jgi:hypothetical protein
MLLNCNIDFNHMLDFFQGRGNQSAPSKGHMIAEFEESTPVFTRATLD